MFIPAWSGLHEKGLAYRGYWDWERTDGAKALFTEQGICQPRCVQRQDWELITTLIDVNIFR